MGKNIRTLWIASILIIIISVICAVIILKFFDRQQTALIGDSFGVLNTIISGLAFAGLIVAILIQKTELQYQREELQLQRKEMAMNREEMKLQREELNKTREEFLIERATNLVYNQLERVEKVIDQFYLDNNTQGKKSFLYINEINGTKSFGKIDSFIDNNLESIVIMADSMFNATHVVEDQVLLLRYDLGIWELIKLKSLFFRNIGSTNLDTLKLILNSLIRLHNYSEQKNISQHKMQLITSAKMHLADILDFRHMILNQETLKILDQRERNNL